MPTNFKLSWRAGVAPIQWPILRSEESAPDAASAVHTTPPTIIVTNMPLPPDRPSLSITKPVTIRVSMVIPDTGLVPTMAIARAATGANRNAMSITSAVATRAEVRDPPTPTPNEKKTKAATAKITSPTIANWPESERSTRGTLVTSRRSWWLMPTMLAPIERTIEGSADRMPRMPAPAIPPTPMMRT